MPFGTLNSHTAIQHCVIRTLTPFRCCSNNMPGIAVFTLTSIYWVCTVIVHFPGVVRVDNDAKLFLFGTTKKLAAVSRCVHSAGECSVWHRCTTAATYDHFQSNYLTLQWVKRNCDVTMKTRCRDVTEAIEGLIVFGKQQ